jgi:predicted alpha/beta hydrolase
MKAIVYKSNCGHTKDYALLLAEAMVLVAYSLNEAKSRLKPHDEIVFLGWIMAGKIQGLNKVRSRYALRAVVGVGMSDPSDEYSRQLASMNKLNEESTFYLQGGFDFHKLKGLYRFMMGMVIKGFKNKDGNLSEADAKMVEMSENNPNYVSSENLRPLISYLENKS